MQNFIELDEIPVNQMDNEFLEVLSEVSDFDTAEYELEDKDWFED